MIKAVRLSTRAQKQLKSVPSYIYDKLQHWIESVREMGLENVRKTRSYHDEPLQGVRKGQRSIRLNKAYRAIYEIHTDGSVEFISVEEVNKHDY